MAKSSQSTMSESYRQGLKEIAGIDPIHGEAFVEELKAVSPDFADYFVGFAFGEIHARSVLEPKIKELVSVTSLLAMGASHLHLKLRISGALRIGCTKDEIIEVIIQSIVHVGFMRAIAALRIVKEICEEGDPSSKR